MSQSHFFNTDSNWSWYSISIQLYMPFNFTVLLLLWNLWTKGHANIKGFRKNLAFVLCSKSPLLLFRSSPPPHWLLVTFICITHKRSQFIKLTWKTMEQLITHISGNLTTWQLFLNSLCIRTFQHSAQRVSNKFLEMLYAHNDTSDTLTFYTL